MLNVNVPNVPLAEVRGLRPARLASFGAVQFNVVEKGEGYAKIGLSEMDAELETGTDAALVADGWATVTCPTGCVSGRRPGSPAGLGPS